MTHRRSWVFFQEYVNALCIVTTAQVTVLSDVCPRTHLAAPARLAVFYNRMLTPPLVLHGKKRNLIMADDLEPCFGVTTALDGQEFDR